MALQTILLTLAFLLIAHWSMGITLVCIILGWMIWRHRPKGEDRFPVDPDKF